ncbi:hypothetical protein BGZ54_007232 [Gamsiella multidivaricata]|nr:hypothetical protein BGZ54_007232 [Gamsiella multidivaricata]
MSRALLYPLLVAATALLLASQISAAPQYLLSNLDLADPAAIHNAPASSIYADNVPSASSPIPTVASQVLPKQSISLGSETNIIPTTGVFPNLVFQPAIQLYDPIVSDFQTYGMNVLGGPNGPLGGPASGLVESAPGFEAPAEFLPGTIGSLAKRQLVPTIPAVPGPAGRSASPPNIISGAPNDISTDTLIQPIVNIQPHALQPVPVPVSTPYNVPVPVGVPVSSPGAGFRGDEVLGNTCDWYDYGSEGGCGWGDWGDWEDWEC